MYIKQEQLLIDIKYNDLFQVLTEDDNLRIRKGDMVELGRADIIDFLQHVKLFEKRIEERLKKLNEKKDGKG